MYLLRQLRTSRLRKVLLDQQEFYRRAWTPDAIREWQLDKFNDQWQFIYRNVPYFQRSEIGKYLPQCFSSWDEFKESMPVMDRKTLQNRCQALTNRMRPPDFWSATGGSTAEPVQIPTWKSERGFTAMDLWYGRSWFGVAPSDKLFLIWGHSHLLGSGARGWVNGIERRLKDALLGYYRYSAYDLSERGLREAAKALLEFQPAYVLGYAVALDRFARVNQDYTESFYKVGLKVAIATAESFPRPDSAGLIAQVLGCPVVMEYGAVETGPIAHQTLAGKYQVFWRHHFLEGHESEYLPGAYEILVTSLYPRCLPLIRYRVGDLISADSSDGDFGQGFEAVTGRCNDLMVLRSGAVVHSEAFSHAVREISSILCFQVTESVNRDITLQYVAAEPLKQDEVVGIRDRLKKIHSELAGIRIARVESLEQTIAGKSRPIRRES